MSQRKLISAIIIAKNEALRIGTAIDALKFCDEVVVADNGSSDETVQVARVHGATVILNHTDDFAKLRNDAVSHTTGEWLLYIDADEVVSQTLAGSVKKAVAFWSAGAPTSYRLERINYFLGKRWPGSERMLRLFKRSALKKWKGQIHETAISQGPVGDLTGELRHDTHRSLEEMVTKTNEWSETEARLRLDAKHPRITWWRLLRVTFTGFTDTFIGKGGWKAGVVGWIESLYQGFSMFITYAKLWEMQRQQKGP